VVDQALPASVHEQQTSQQKNTALAYAVHVPVRTSSHPTVSSSRSSHSAPFAFVFSHPPGELNQSVFRFTSTVEGDLWSAIAAHTPKRRRARRLPDSVPDPRLSPRVHRPGSEAHGPGSLLSIPPLDPPDRREGKEGQNVPVARSDAMGFDRPRDACVSASGGREEDSWQGNTELMACAWNEAVAFGPGRLPTGLHSGDRKTANVSIQTKTHRRIVQTRRGTNGIHTNRTQKTGTRSVHPSPPCFSWTKATPNLRRIRAPSNQQEPVRERSLLPTSRVLAWREMSKTRMEGSEESARSRRSCQMRTGLLEGVRNCSWDYPPRTLHVRCIRVRAQARFGRRGGPRDFWPVAGACLLRANKCFCT